MSAKRTGSKTSKSKTAPATARAAKKKLPAAKTAKASPSKQPPAKAATAKAPVAKKAKTRAATKPASPTNDSIEAFYFFIEGAEPRVADARPATMGEVAAAGDFAAARDMAVDYLIDLIDTLEQRLWQFKQAEDYAAYRSLLNGR